MAVDVSPSSKISKPIVYISSQIIDYERSESSSLDYFVLLLALIINKTRGITDQDVVVKIAKSVVDPSHQLELIHEVFQNKERFSGVIISPVNEPLVKDALETKIKSFEDYQTLPVITIDKKIDGPVNDVHIPGITSNWYNGGACAAQLILDYRFRHRPGNVDQYSNVLIMPGLESSPQRISGFTDYLEGQKCTISKTDRVNFTREGAKNEIISFVNRKGFDDIDFVFACNDEMALGVLDAIQQLDLNVKKRKFPATKIVGFDGTAEFLNMMKTNELLLGTVNVNLRSQVSQLIQNIKELFSVDKFYSLSDLKGYSHEERYEAKKSEKCFPKSS
jgi:ABC-type sugar transport system substrate-binding protein